LIDTEASILGYHYEAEFEPFETTTYRLMHTGRSPTVSVKHSYTIYTGHDSLLTRWNGPGETPDQYRISMYGDFTYIHRLYDNGKVAAYSIVELDSGYRLSITGKPFTVLFPSWSAEKVQDEVSQAFDIGVLMITIRREAETAWEAVENLGMDEDEEFLAYELVETSDLAGTNDDFLEVNATEVMCGA